MTRVSGVIMRRLRGFSVQVCLALIVSQGLIAQDSNAPAEPVWKAPETDTSTPYASLRGLKTWRLVLPTRAYRDTLSIRLEAGPKVLAKDAPDTFQATIILSSEDGDQEVREPIDISALYPPAIRSKHRSPFVGSVEIDISDWSDGPISASVEWGSVVEPKTTTVATGAIQRALWASIPDVHRPEVGQWLDEVNTPRAIWGKLPTWKNLDIVLDRLANGWENDPFSGIRGFLLRSYESRFLGRRQPYSVYVPKALDLDQPAPLLILLHGSGGDYRNIISDFHAGHRFEEHPMLIANAGAFYYQEYRHAAKTDVMDIIEDMAKKYKVDRDRIYLQGISLGGRGTLKIAALEPDLFAALSAHGVYGMQLELTDPGQSLDDDRVARSYRSQSDARMWLTNIHHIPTEICTGQDDGNTPPEQGLLFAHLLKEHGNTSVRHRLFPTDHNISLPHYDWVTTREWMLTHKRLPAQDRMDINFRIPTLRYSRSAWVQVDALQDYAFPGRIRARIVERPRVDETDQDESTKASDETPEADEDVKPKAKSEEPQTVDHVLTVKAANITQFQMDCPKEIIRLDVDGQTVYEGEAVRRAWHLKVVDGAWELVESKAYADLLPVSGEAEPQTAPLSHKTSMQSGPMWDVYSAPVLWVYDDSSGPEPEGEQDLSLNAFNETADGESVELSTTGRLRRGAEYSARWDCTWGESMLSVLPLSQLTEEQRASHNVILLTNDVGACPLLKTITLPKPFTDEGEGPRGNVSAAIRPSPWSKNHYLFIFENRHPSAPVSTRLLAGDEGMYADWVEMNLEQIARENGSRSWQSAIVNAGSYDHFWKPQSETEIDFRSYLMLGPKARGG